MNALQQRWKALAMRIDGLSFRERLLVLAGAAGVTLSLLFVGLIEPVQKQQQLMLLTTSGLQMEISPLREQLAEAQRLTQDGQDGELARLRETATTLEQAIKARESGLVAPARLVAILKTLLAEQPGLELLEVATAPAQAALPKPDDSQEALPAAESFYKHGITLRVRGSYAHLTTYLMRLESEPWTVQWESMRIDANQHPWLELTLRLNTLSREPTWAHL